MEILLGDRTAQLESMPNTVSNAETNAELLRRVKVGFFDIFVISKLNWWSFWIEFFPLVVK